MSCFTLCQHTAFFFIYLWSFEFSTFNHFNLFLFSFTDTHVCLSGQFKCTKNQKCIPINLRCNGQDDCGDEEDERDCRKLCLQNFVLWLVLNGELEENTGNVFYLKQFENVQAVNSQDCVQCFIYKKRKVKCHLLTPNVKSLQRRKGL